MTLILTSVTPDYVVQTSDRLTSKLTRDGPRPHDVFANKTIIYRAEDGVAAISYSGLAYIGGVPTDSHLANILWGAVIHNGPDGRRLGTLVGQPPNRLTVAQAIGELKKAVEAVPKLRCRQGGGLFIHVAGWVEARPRRRPFCVEIERGPTAERAIVSGMGRYDHTDRRYRLYRVGASPQNAHIAAELDRYRPSRRLSALDAEDVHVKVTRRTAAATPGVGRHVLSVILPDPLTQPLICRFLPDAPHEALLTHAAGQTRIEVAHTPWILTPGMAQSPQLHVGIADIDLGGLGLRLIGAPPQGALGGLSSSVQRPTP